MKRTLGLVALGLLMAAPASAAVVNGSFETLPGPLSNGNWGIFSTINGWSELGSNGIEIQTNATLDTIDAQEGDRYVELDTTQNSAMRQILNLTAGRYLLSFWYAPRENNPVSDGISYAIENLTGTINTSFKPLNGWTLVTGEFNTLGGEVNLDFAALGGDGDHVSFGGLLDNVSVAAVPVPAAGLMLFAALGGLAALRRRKTVS